MKREQNHMHILCESCKNALPFTGCDDCIECVADHLIANPEELASLRRIHRGTEWIKQLDAQIERELARRVPAGVQRSQVAA
jgi:hypothetical protein